MMLRLVLVGMVAALGVSIPSQPSCEHWYDSAQAWAMSLMAEWDTWEPSDDRCDSPGRNAEPHRLRGVPARPDAAGGELSGDFAGRVARSGLEKATEKPPQQLLRLRTQ